VEAELLEGFGLLVLGESHGESPVSCFSPRKVKVNRQRL
jgi:hypothetical protein